MAEAGVGPERVLVLLALGLALAAFGEVRVIAAGGGGGGPAPVLPDYAALLPNLAGRCRGGAGHMAPGGRLGDVVQNARNGEAALTVGGRSAQPGKCRMNILTVNLLFSTLVFGLAAKLYLMPRLPDLEPRSVVLPILLLHAFRHLGLMFLAPGAVYPGIPEEFAHPAALGDMLAAALALIAIPAVVGRSRLARPLVGLFNVEGTLDLIVAILLATAYNAAPYMGPAYWIPAFWVPALLVTHCVVFVLLGGRWIGPM